MIVILWNFLVVHIAKLRRHAAISNAARRNAQPLCAAAAAKSLQSCPTLCNPISGSPPGSSVPGTLQARISEWVAISFSQPLCETVPTEVLRLSLQTFGSC